MKILAKMNLPNSSWVSILEQTLLIASAASLTYLSQNIAKIDFGVWSPAVVAFISVLATWVNTVVNNKPAA